MYHYLKWAAFSLFLKHNLRYLLLILVSIIGIYAVDGIYRDLVDYMIATDQKGRIVWLLVGKWTIVVSLSILLVYSILQLGFGKGAVSEKKKEKGSKRQKEAEGTEEEEDPVMKRLEKFRHKERLRRKSDILMERMKKK